MKDSVFPGDTMVFNGKVASVETDAAGCGWANLQLVLSVGDKPVTDCTARIALPLDADDNPWQRTGDDWNP
jgi:alcohol dehydrogenase YqhD (iron-dependent ADH family)